MEKAKRSLIRIERIDGETVNGFLDSDDPEELIAMLGDALAEILDKNPRHWRGARRLFRRVFRDWREPWWAGIVEFWHGRIVSGVIGAAALTGVIYGASYIAHLLGVA